MASQKTLGTRCRPFTAITGLGVPKLETEKVMKVVVVRNKGSYNPFGKKSIKCIMWVYYT